jgi:hypothetical protein
MAGSCGTDRRRIVMSERYLLLGETEDMGDERELVADDEKELVRMEIVHSGQARPSDLSYRYDIEEDDAEEYLEDLAEEGVCAPWSEYEEAKLAYDRADDQATFDAFE